MIDITAIREALAASLASIPDLAESPWLLSNPTAPAAEVQPGPIDYDGTMQRGLDTCNFIVRVFVGLTTEIGAQKRLDRMLTSDGPESVKAALEADTTLGELVDDLHVTRCSGARAFVREGQAAVLGAEWELYVIAPGQ